MPQSNREKKALLKKRRAKLGLIRKEFWLNEKETVAVKDFIINLRKQDE